MSIDYELDRLMDAWDAKHAEVQRRRKISRGTFLAHREKVGPDAHPLRRHRVAFREGLTVDELSERSTVSARTIRAIERGESGAGSDLTWERLCRALDGVARSRVDPSYLYTG